MLLLLGVRAEPAIAQDEPGRHRDGATEIVLLGTSHLANASSEMETIDILSDRRQEQLDAVAESIARWGTDRFFVECSPDEQAALDSVYRTYRAGEYDLREPAGRAGRGEIQQLGFRAAAAAGLDGVDCVDAEVFLPDARAQKVAARHNPELYRRFEQYVEKIRSRESPLAGRTVREAYLALNRDSALYNRYYQYYHPRMGTFDGAGAKIRRDSELAGSTFAAPFELAERHMDQLREAIASVDAELVDSVGPETDYVVLLDDEAAASESGPGTGADTVSTSELSDLLERTSTTWVGFPDHHIGADMVGQWYKRNLRIYANIWRAVEKDDDRVLLLMGQSHVWPLRHFFRGNPEFEVVPVDDVL